MGNKMRVTRHNGRAGKNGVYNPKHNDRSFDVKSSEHIDQERIKQNIYWDWVRGQSDWEDHNPDEDLLDLRFENIEKVFYDRQYRDYCDGQHERNRRSGHSKRDRSPDDLRMNKKTCPEESLIQIGHMEEHVEPEVLLHIVKELFAWFDESFGSHIHILDWGLHCDESTPHIHERHVFDYENEYGEIEPKQEKALEALGIDLPFPDKPNSKTNNRKVMFDSIVRAKLMEIAKAHGISLEEEPIYGGKEYLEKQDFIREKQRQTITLQQQEIIEKQGVINQQEYEIFQKKNDIADYDIQIMDAKKEIIEKENVLDDLIMRIDDVEQLVNEVSEAAYDKAVEVVTNTVREETTKANITEIETYQKWVNSDRSKIKPADRNLVTKVLDAVISRLKRSVSLVAEKVMNALHNPKIKEENLSAVRESARQSVLENLNNNKQIVREKVHHGRGITEREEL